MQAHVKHNVYEVFAQIEPGGPISHIGNLNAPGLELARAKKDKTESASFAREYVSNFLTGEPAPGIEAEYAMAAAMLPAVTAADLIRLYRRHELSPVEVVRDVLARIEKYNPAINAFILVDAEGALAAAREGLARMDKLNENRTRPLRCGIGLHLGELTYGNIGTPSRIEFTVIGAAANEAARIESLCKRLEVDLLVSERVARALPGAWRSLGSHTLRGVGDKMELFTLS